jgi:hypothetical protein
MVFFYYTIPLLKFRIFTQGRKKEQKEADFKAKSPQNQPKKRKKYPYILSILQNFFEKIAK